VSLSHKTTSEKSQADIFSFPLTSDTATAADQVAKLSVIATPFPKQVEFSRPTASHSHHDLFSCLVRLDEA